jgi:hypothetical protein
MNQYGPVGQPVMCKDVPFPPDSQGSRLKGSPKGQERQEMSKGKKSCRVLHKTQPITVNRTLFTYSHNSFARMSVIVSEPKAEPKLIGIREDELRRTTKGPSG